MLHISVVEGLVDIIELLIDPSNEVDLTLQDKVVHYEHCVIVDVRFHY